MKKFLFILLFLAFPIFVLAGQIEINTASIKQLDEITGVGPVLAQRIIDGRPYSSVDDLLKVKGIGEKTLQKIKDQGLAFVTVTATSDVAVVEKPAKLAEDSPPPVYPTGVVINEILPSPEGADDQNEWIELYNTNNFEIDLSGWIVKDKSGATIKYSLPEDTKISAYGYLILKRLDTKITLNNTTDGLFLYWPNENIIDSMVYEKAPANQSYNKTNTGWQWSTSLTPGVKNIIVQNNNIQKIQKSDNIESLPKLEKFDNNNEISAGVANISQSANPWFLFITAIIITIISAITMLFIKLNLKKHVRT